MAPWAWARLAAKDLRLELRTKELLNAMGVLALLVAVVGVLAFHDVGAPAAAVAGTVWVAVTFSTALGMARAFTAERDRGTLDGLLLLPVDRGAILAGKVASGLVVVAVVEALTLAAVAVAFGLPVHAGWTLLAVVLLLGSVGVVVAGALLSAVAMHARAREVLAPALLAPVALPALIAAVHGTADALAGAGWPALRGEITLLLGYDIAMAGVSWLLFETALEG